MEISMTIRMVKNSIKMHNNLHCKESNKWWLWQWIMIVWSALNSWNILWDVLRRCQVSEGTKSLSELGNALLKLWGLWSLRSCLTVPSRSSSVCDRTYEWPNSIMQISEFLAKSLNQHFPNALAQRLKNLLLSYFLQSHTQEAAENGRSGK